MHRPPKLKTNIRPQAKDDRHGTFASRYGPAFLLAALGPGLVVSVAFWLEAASDSPPMVQGMLIGTVVMVVPALFVIVSSVLDRPRRRSSSPATGSDATLTESAAPDPGIDADGDKDGDLDADNDSDIDNVLQRRLAARRALPEALAGLRVGAASEDRRCGYCHDDDQSEALEECVYCGVTLHGDCLREHGRCPTPGCLAADSWRPGSMIHAPMAELEQPRSEFEHVVGLNYRANRVVLLLLATIGLALGFYLSHVEAGVELAFFALSAGSVVGLLVLELWKRTDSS